MDAQTLTLFIACLGFSGFNALLNLNTNRAVLFKTLTFLLTLVGLAGAFYLLLASLIRFFEKAF